MDERYVRELNALLSPLREPPALTNRLGTDLLTGRWGDPPPDVGPDTELIGGRLYRVSRALPDAIWSVRADSEQKEDVLLMADMLLQEILKTDSGYSKLEETYRRILMNVLDEWELEDAVAAEGIERKLPRAVLLLEADVHWRGDLMALLREVLPLNNRDTIVPIDAHTAAYLADMSVMEDRADLLEYATAAQESVMSEGGCSLVIGVGGTASDVVGLHASYDQARRAIDLGRIYLPHVTVLDYQRMLMPRFMSELPPNLAAEYYYSMFNADTAKLFTEEMLETVSMFFEKDLNLSDTARQLYIHRNTLTYRLDKIEKATGLDLRKFEDAVTFKMLMEMKKRVLHL